MTERIIIAGAGGQGVMLLGKVLAESALREGKQVTWFPCYGAEVRGGTAYCMVVISDKPVGSPYVDKADTLIVLNEPSLVKFGKRVAASGLLVANSSLIQKETLVMLGRQSCVALAFTDMAVKLGDIRVANMIALGYFIARKQLIRAKTVYAVMQAMAPQGKPELVAINTKALQEGIQLYG
ncbi:MAG: 2-oxoacid:acceptor oxidoreductase family protein [Candidatus Omnitrophica bacterium]|nr:2-oxoacid:acceptor oxidoreductase family protein [Candidatus Omnitrophota bacterium]